MTATPFDRDYLATFPEDNPLPVFETDLEGCTVFANDSAEARFPGLRERGLTLPELGPLATFVETLHSGTVGETRALEFSAADDDYQVAVIRYPERVRFYATDITNRVRAERMLTENERRFRATFEQAAVGMAHVALDGRLIRVNERLCELTGYHRSDLEQMNFRDLVHPEDLPRNLEQTDRLLRGEIDKFTLEQRYLRKDGAYPSMLLTASLVRSAKGQPDYMVRVVQDISQRIEAERKAARELEISNLLLESAHALALNLDLTELCNTLAEVSAGVCDRSRALVLMYDSDASELIIAGSHASSVTSGVRYDSAELPPVLWEALMTGESLIADFSDSELGAQAAEFVRDHSIRLALIVPIVDGAGTVGVIAVDGRDSSEPFSERDVMLVEAVAAQASIAIRNARHFGREHDLADTLQEMLLVLPKHVCGVSFARRYRSASDSARVGGDFVDLFECADGAVTLVLGDVSGKGISAATVTSLVRDTLRAFSIHGLMPGELFSQANEVVCRFTATERFVTSFLGRLDTETGALRYAQAGHPPALVVNDAGVVRVLDNGNPVLGAVSGVLYHDAEVGLGPDDCLLLYTDGVTEARGGAGMFGEQRLTDTLAGLGGCTAEQVVEGVMQAVTEFAHGQLNDDIALLAVRRDAGAG